MKTKIAIVILVLAALLQAKETALLPEDHGVLGALKRMGCDSSWLSVAMRESYILESELEQLQAGTKIVAPDMCDSEEPAHEDVVITKKILAREQTLRKVRQFEREKESLWSSYDAQKKTLESVIAEKEHLSTQVLLLKTDLALTKTDLQRARTDLAKPRSSPTSTKLAYAIIGIVCASIVWILGLLWYRGGVEILPLQIEHVHVGKPVVFTLVPEERHYKCPICPADDILPRNFERHMNRTHPSMRLVVVGASAGVS